MFTLGLGLQLLASRSLTQRDYATFVFGLAIGNVAQSLASAIQPVVAKQARARFLPIPLRLALVLGGGVCATAWAALGWPVGFTVAALALSQLPLHALVGVGMGVLQRARKFTAMAVIIPSFAAVRLVSVLPWLWAGHLQSWQFVMALPLGLLVMGGLVGSFGGFRGLDWRPTSNRAALIPSYGLWLSIAWLLNSDGLYGRLFLGEAPSGDYALAFTLGRLPLFAVGPLVTILLSSLLDRATQQRGRLVLGILIASTILFLGSILTLGVHAQTAIDLLSGDASGRSVRLLRVYAIQGPTAALLTMMVTLLYGVGHLPSSWLIASGTLITLAIAWATGSAVALATAQLVVTGSVAAWCTWLGIRACRVDPSAVVEDAGKLL